MSPSTENPSPQRPAGPTGEAAAGRTADRDPGPPSLPAPEKLLVGISACLLGDKVRFDGGHKHDRYITGTLGRFFDWHKVCPEVECGLPIPRETLRLVGPRENPRLITSHSGIDHTERMQAWCRRRLDEIEPFALCGFIFKSGSPSSGMQGVRVYDANGVPAKHGVGLFARAFMNRWPLLPVEDDGRLNDLPLRENFIERVFAYHRWREFLAGPPQPGRLVAFHTREKLALMAHSPQHYRDLGKLVATAGKTDWATLTTEYGTRFMTALKCMATHKRHANVLSHLLGFLKDQLDSHDRHELVELIEEYRRERLPLIVPMTMFRHHFRRHPVDWVRQQSYLEPYPAELLLRNHV